MADRASLSTIRKAIKDVETQVVGYAQGECDERARKAALEFLRGLDVMVGAFCLRMTDGSETLDPCPKP